METRNTPRASWLRPGLVRPVVLLGAVVAALALAACGSSSSDSASSGNAQGLLQQTFSGKHTIHSGVLSFALSANPSGSSTLRGPFSLSLGGPFQSRGTGKLPESDFTIAISGLGRRGALGVVSTGTKGYVTLDGVGYPLPPADFQRVASSFSGVASSGAGHSSLAGFGIDPLRWLEHPSVVGSQTIAGTDTTHIRAGVNVRALLADLDTFLAKTARTAGTTKIPSSIPPATQQEIAAAIHNASVDIWTGKTDHTLRRLALHVMVPVSGQISTLLGGLRSAAIELSLQYSHLNQPQTITAPTNIRPYSELTAKLGAIASALEGGLGSAALGSAAPGSGGAASASKVGKYSHCIEQAGQDVLKMQKCASLLNGG